MEIKVHNKVAGVEAMNEIAELLYRVIELLNEINDKLPARETDSWLKYTPEPTENEHD